MRHARLLAALLALPLPGCGIVNSYVYQPPSATEATVRPADADLVRVTTRDGLLLEGLALPARAGHPTLLVFNGNASTPADMIAWLRPLAHAGYGIVAAGYRGYAGNPGRPSEAGLAADADAFHAEALRRAGTGPLIVVGHSLGGGVALGLARRSRLDAVVTVGAFSQLRAMAPRLARAMVRDRYDNAAAVAQLNEPLFIVHAVDDDVVPASEGNLLDTAATAAGARGGSFVLSRGGHMPDGHQMRQVLDAVRQRMAGGDPQLPAATRFVPFG